MDAGVNIGRGMDASQKQEALKKRFTKAVINSQDDLLDMIANEPSTNGHAKPETVDEEAISEAASQKGILEKRRSRKKVSPMKVDPPKN